MNKDIHILEKIILWKRRIEIRNEVEEKCGRLRKKIRLRIRKKDKRKCVEELLIKKKVCVIMRLMNTIQEIENLIDGEKKEKFEAFAALLLEYNKKYNLTAITERDEVRVKHFLDSAMGAYAFEQNANVLEVGSGGGFPSIPLMILREDLHFTLMESIGKKCEFLQIATEKLGLLQAKVVCKRAEDAAREVAFREKFDVVCARAVARLNTLCEYCLPFVKVGGKFVAYKGIAEEEVKESGHAMLVLGGKLEQVDCYELPQNGGARAIVQIKKVKATPEKYPRGQGKERKKPL